MVVAGEAVDVAMLAVEGSLGGVGNGMGGWCRNQFGCLEAAKKWNIPTFRCLGVVKTPNAYNGPSDGHFPRLELSTRQNLTGR